MQHAERLCDRLLFLAHGRKQFEGTQDEARATLPVEADDWSASSRRWHCRAWSRCGPSWSRPDGWSDWEVRLEPGAIPGDLLEQCTARGFPLRRFEQRRPSLHDVFLHIVGSAEARS